MIFDILGAFFSLWATYYFIKINKFAWLITLLATSFNAYLYWKERIYADMFLEISYFVSAGYGWFLWNNPSKKTKEILITYRFTPQSWCLLLGCIALLYILFAYLLKTYTNSNIIELDALTTALSLMAQVLMSYKVIFTWVLWLITDALYAYLYFTKTLPFHAGLMILYISMAIIGYYNWMKKKPKHQNDLSTSIFSVKAKRFKAIPHSKYEV